MLSIELIVELVVRDVIIAFLEISIGNHDGGPDATRFDGLSAPHGFNPKAGR